MRRFTPAAFALLALAIAAPGGVAAQEPTPLDRQDVERLVSGDTYTQEEVAAIVDRACLSFEPTAGDFERFRGLGASEAVLEALRACAAAGEGDEPSPEALDLSLEDDSLLTSVGSAVTLDVGVSRAGVPRAGVALVLEGSEGLPGVDRPLEARTDSAGNAAFRLPVGTVPGRHAFRVLAGGYALRGANRVFLRVIPGEPASATVRPERLELAPGREEPVEVTVAVADGFGNPVPEAVVRVRGSGPGVAAGPWRTATGPEGTASVRIPAAELRGVERLQARAGEDAVAEVAVALLETEDRGAEEPEPAPAAPDTAREAPPVEAAAGDGAGATVSLSAWGGNTFDNGRDFGFRAGRLAVSPAPGVEIWGRFDHTLAMVRPYTKRGEVDDISFFGGFAFDWGSEGRFATWVEGGRRQHAVTDEWETLGHLRQTVRFGDGDAPAFERASIMVGGFVGDWLDRTDWGVEAGFGIPASPSFRLEGLGAVTETVAMRADPTLVGARDTRFELTGRIRAGGWEIAPTGVVGSVSDSDLGEEREGELFEGRLYVETAAIGGVARLLGFFRIQDHPASDDFSQAAVGIRLGSDR